MNETQLVEMVSQHLFELSTIGIIIFDAKQKALKANGRLFDWLGYTSEEIEGMSLMEMPFIPLKSKVIAAGNFAKRMIGGKVEPYLIEFIDKQGRKLIGRVDARVVEGRDGGEKINLVMITNVTGDQQHEEELLKLRVGLEKSNDIIFITNSEGVIEYVNSAFERVYGYVQEEWRGKTPRILKSGDKSAEWYKRFWDTLLAGKTVKAMMMNKAKGGRVVEVEAMVNPIINALGENEGFLAIQRDVTVSNQAARELLIKSEDLERMNRLMVDREMKMVEMKAEVERLRGGLRPAGEGGEK